MRIAYVVADRGIPVFGTKGASIHVREMVNAFADLGHGVTLVAARRGERASPVRASIVEVRGKATADITALLSLELEERIRAKELRAIGISQSIHEELVLRHRRERFDLIYERYTLFGSGGIRAARELGVPYVVEMNAPLLLEQQKFRLLHHVTQALAVESEILTGADCVLAVSEEVHRYALSKGASPERAHVVPNGVDLVRFNASVEAHAIGCLARGFVVGFVGSLKPWHGIEVLMDAFRELAHRSDAYRLLIVGDGPLRDWIAGYARGVDLTDRVTMIGSVSHEMVPGLIKAMDVAVAPYPALEDFYFSPLKLYEYLAVGTPVVASNLGQIAGAVQDGVTGLLARPGDAQNLAECIDRLRLDDSLRAEMGRQAARSGALRSWELNAQKVVEFVAPVVTAA